MDSRLTPDDLKRFPLLGSLSRDSLGKVLECIGTHDLAPGETLFREGDRDGFILFLLQGSIMLKAGQSGSPLVIDAATDSAQLPLSRLKPRRYTATATTKASVAALDEDWLDNLLTVDQTASYEVSVIEGEDPEWMFRLFSSPTFRHVPADNLASLFGLLEPVEVIAGQNVIQQGEAGDYYYLVRRGSAEIWRSFNGRAPVKVAELGVGDGFGEEALLSGEPRNASVVMQTDGLLMRLSQENFNTLLKPVLVRRLDLAAAARQIGRGARFIDVRIESEFLEHNLPGSLNHPLCNLRSSARSLDPGHPYIAVCQTGRRAAVAAFLLNQRGFNVQVLDGGLNAVRALD